MPVDSAGNRADIVMDPNSTINRANPGRFFEQYLNASRRDAYKQVLAMTGIQAGTVRYRAETALRKMPEDQFKAVTTLLLDYYRIAAPEMYSWFESGEISQDYESMIGYVSEIIEKGLGIHKPTNQQKPTDDIIIELEHSRFKPTYGPVTYVGNSGRRVTTKKPVRIGELYFIVLEKIADDWAAVSSAKTQHFGVPAQLTKQDKYTKPARQQAVRGAGEAEVRIFVSNIGPRWVAELMDRNNNPLTHRSMVEKLLTAPNPSNIENLVDRREIPFGGARPLVLIKHLIEVSGAKFAYKPYDHTLQSMTYNIELTDEKEDLS